MAVAWSKDKVGPRHGDVIVRDPVVLTATLPRFLLTGDRGTMRLDLDNVEGPRPATIGGEVPATARSASPGRASHPLDAKKRAALGAAARGNRVGGTARSTCASRRPGRLRARAQLSRSR